MPVCGEKFLDNVRSTRQLLRVEPGLYRQRNLVLFVRVFDISLAYRLDSSVSNPANNGSFLHVKGGNWFVRRLQHFSDRVIVMHGHRHTDWIGKCADLVIVSAPSPVMEATDSVDTYFWIQTVAIGADVRLRLLAPERISLRGQRNGDGA